MEFLKCLFVDKVGDIFMPNPILPFTMICILALRLGYRPVAITEWLCRFEIGHGKFAFPKRCKLSSFLAKGGKARRRMKRVSTRNKPTPGVRGGVSKGRKAKQFRSVLPRLRCDPHPHTPSSVVGARSTSTLQSERQTHPVTAIGANQAHVQRAEAARTSTPPNPYQGSNKVIITNLPPSMFTQTWIMDFCESEGMLVIDLSLGDNRVAEIELGSDEEAEELVEIGREHLGELGATISLG